MSVYGRGGEPAACKIFQRGLRAVRKENIEKVPEQTSTPQPMHAFFFLVITSFLALFSGLHYVVTLAMQPDQISATVSKIWQKLQYIAQILRGLRLISNF